MNNSYRKDFINKQRTGMYARNYIMGGKSSRKNFYRKILKQLLISILIVSALILIKSINTPLTNKISSTIKISIQKEFNYKSGFNSLREFASNITKETKELTNHIPVFNNQSINYKFEKPLEGIVISSFGEKYDPISNKVSFQRGLDIEKYDDGIVKSIEAGVVETLGESDALGKFVKVRHNQNLFTIYSNLSGILVEENQNIVKGEQIGEISEENSYLHFELWIDNEAVDPQDYLEYSYTNI